MTSVTIQEEIYTPYMIRKFRVSLTERGEDMGSTKYLRDDTPVKIDPSVLPWLCGCSDQEQRYHICTQLHEYFPGLPSDA